MVYVRVLALEAGSAPKVFLRSTHLATLKIVPLELLREHALDAAEVRERSCHLMHHVSGSHLRRGVNQGLVFEQLP